MNVLYSAVYSSGCHPFDTLADRIQGVNFPEQLVDTDSALVVWGGADINPSLYKHKQSDTTWPGGRRDFIEWDLIQAAIKLGIPIIGVCRGAQMLCAAAGGFLIQDVRNHAGHRHDCTTYDGQTIQVNSIHHQMMAGYEKVDHDLLAWSSEPLSKGHYKYQDDQDYKLPEGFVEPEAIVFNAIKGFAVQWHPEAMNIDSNATQFIFKEYHARYSKSTA